MKIEFLDLAQADLIDGFNLHHMHDRGTAREEPAAGLEPLTRLGA